MKNSRNWVLVNPRRSTTSLYNIRKKMRCRGLYEAGVVRNEVVPQDLDFKEDGFYRYHENGFDFAPPVITTGDRKFQVV